MPFESARAVTLPIGAAINQYRIVTVDTSGEAVEAAAGADNVVGVTLEGVTTAQFDSGDGQVTVPVAVLDGSKLRIEASAAISVGDVVGAAAAGEARTAVTGDGIVGIALEASAAQGDIITVLTAGGKSLAP